jgi:hypothetical protein
VETEIHDSGAWSPDALEDDRDVPAKRRPALDLEALNIRLSADPRQRRNPGDLSSDS